MKSEYLFLGMRLASSVAGYHISVTSVRGCLVKLSMRLLSTKTVVVTPTGKGPIKSGSGGLTFAVLPRALTAKKRTNASVAAKAETLALNIGDSPRRQLVEARPFRLL